MKRSVLAIDIGASGGRVMRAKFDGEKIQLEEVHRFSNTPVQMAGHLHIDLLRMLHGIQEGLSRAAKKGFDSVGLDTWGVDYGLLAPYGTPLMSPILYRDGRTAGMLRQAEAYMPADELYLRTGTQLMEINTAFQLLWEKENRPELLTVADKLLMLPDLYNYLLTGNAKAELSIASTTQLLSTETGQWSEEIIEAFGLPRTLFPELVPAGTRLGTLLPELCSRLELPEAEVYAVCGHDTQCAMAAVPTQEDDFFFISCGTWALVGTELSDAIVTGQSARLNLTNERGYDGKTSFLRNNTGLWLIQECQRYLAAHGESYTFSQLEALALSEKPFCCFVDTDDPRLSEPGNLPERIRMICKEHGQPVPASTAALMRCIYDSLAMKFALSLAQIRACTGKHPSAIHMLGGGTKDAVLCQLTANVCGLPVLAGPREATVYGNVIIQLIASGAIADLKSARKVIADSVTITEYLPETNCTEAYHAYLKATDQESAMLLQEREDV